MLRNSASERQAFGKSFQKTRGSKRSESVIQVEQCLKLRASAQHKSCSGSTSLESKNFHLRHELYQCLWPLSDKSRRANGRHASPHSAACVALFACIMYLVSQIGGRVVEAGPQQSLGSLNGQELQPLGELELDQEEQQPQAGHQKPQEQDESWPRTRTQAANSQAPTERDKMKTLEQFLETLPTVSLAQRHTATFECELDRQPPPGSSLQLIWLQLKKPNRSSERSTPGHDIKLISLNEKIISPERRFTVRRQSALKWLLSVDNVQPNDHLVYFLCQTNAANQTNGGGGSSFVGGGRLNVLVPPKIVEEETSGSLVQANEFEPLTLRCKVISEPRSQLTWKREDGTSLAGLEQRNSHELRRLAGGQIVSVDSSELLFGSISRRQSGAYLCIASNGVQPGVSQRASVGVVNCRSHAGPSGRSEPCAAPEVGVTSSESPRPAAPAMGKQRARFPAGGGVQAGGRQIGGEPVHRRIGSGSAERRRAQGRNADGQGSIKAADSEERAAGTRRGAQAAVAAGAKGSTDGRLISGPGLVLAAALALATATLAHHYGPR